ncbi:hypothetical protein Pelo_15698 [Pelomyxa schiedti]|nr:hypothetical protein Pelo_15698 [Pelomyxa schiedti]
MKAARSKPPAQRLGLPTPNPTQQLVEALASRDWAAAEAAASSPEADPNAASLHCRGASLVHSLVSELCGCDGGSSSSLAHSDMQSGLRLLRLLVWHPKFDPWACRDSLLAPARPPAFMEVDTSGEIIPAAGGGGGRRAWDVLVPWAISTGETAVLVHVVALLGPRMMEYVSHAQTVCDSRDASPLYAAEKAPAVIPPGMEYNAAFILHPLPSQAHTST